MSTSNPVYTSAFSRRAFVRHGTARHGTARLVDGGISPLRAFSPPSHRTRERVPSDRPSGVHYPLRRRVHATICGVSRGRRVAASFPPRNVPVVTIPRRFRGGRSAEFSNTPRREVGRGKVGRVVLKRRSRTRAGLHTAVTGVLLILAAISRDRLTF